MGFAVNASTMGMAVSGLAVAWLGQQIDRFLQHRKRLQPKEVKLHKSRGFDEFHIELGDRHIRTRIAVKRDQFGERPVANHNTGRMG